ncbi:probable polygalacturonase isoform X3 [Punica granatum]|uniref:Probable polygalacturonase isoform X3 n=1 Tax=Punica granatum TaxID=22663 RepID=A0A6P8C7N0_PUNGR|nr:probable polygalacturonase isoform X3 [Punica granatum]
MLVTLLLLLALSNAIEASGEESDGGLCDYKVALDPRPHSVSITEFGAVGDGKTLNTIAFQNAIFYLKSFADKGGAQLYVPPGRWLTGSFNLTSHLTLFLEKGAVVLGSQDPTHWDVVEPLPSYGRGIELPGRRYRSLINGYMLDDVVITGDNGTIDGQGSMWWNWFNNKTLNYSRPHLVEFVSSKSVVVSNLTFLNAPAYNIHPVYCSDVHIQNISISAPPESPFTVGVAPDSSDNVCIEDCTISTGYDSITLKSGWDEYGISYGMPTTNLHIRQVHLQSSAGSTIAFGSEMSGGISQVLIEGAHLYHSSSGVEFRTTRGRGGYITDISISGLEMEDVHLAFSATGQCETHPDDNFDPFALPAVNKIFIQNVTGKNISIAGEFTGIRESPFTSICLSNITLSITSELPASWSCSNVSGHSTSVSPEPCPELQVGVPCLNSSWSGRIFSQSSSIGRAEAL